MNTQSSPNIVGMIAALTDHRDVNLLEASLLKTVADLFAPGWAVLFHVVEDRSGPVFSTALRDGVVSCEEGPQSYAELAGTPGVTSFPIMSHGRTRSSSQGGNGQALGAGRRCRGLEQRARRCRLRV